MTPAVIRPSNDSTTQQRPSLPPTTHTHTTAEPTSPLPAFSPTPGRYQRLLPATFRAWQSHGEPTTPETLPTVDALRDLVKRVLEPEDPLPHQVNAIMPLTEGLCRHLPRLERMAKKQHPALAQRARRLRKSPRPQEYLPLVNHTIWLAEDAQALIKALAPDTATAAVSPPTKPRPA